MEVDEALLVLNLEKSALLEPKPLDTIIKQHSLYFAMNDPEKGGSFYLQSKVYRAKEALEAELRRAASDDGKKTDDA